MRSVSAPAAPLCVLVGLVALGPLSPGGVARARSKVHAGSMSINGQTVRDVSCELEKGDVGAIVDLTVSLAKHKAELEACSHAGATYRVRWTWQKGKPVAVTIVEPADDQGAPCVKALLASTESENEGDCEGTVVIGAVAPAKPSPPKAKAPRPKK